MSIANVISLLGGVALFLFGMSLMGDGLKKVAGEKMRKILEVLTTNPLMGVFVGTVATAIMKSSSATT
ncbi:MAG: Na/Pi cotransporter family protein, partial [Clostridiales bacterium]|nr:Na/Pi cotransporter family protein [Clostridiales bacterium]